MQEEQKVIQRVLIAEAQEAERLLNGPVFTKAYAATREHFIREWQEAKDVASRELAHAKVAGLAEVQRQLRRTISAGEHASRTDAR